MTVGYLFCPWEVGTVPRPASLALYLFAWLRWEGDGLKWERTSAGFSAEEALTLGLYSGTRLALAVLDGGLGEGLKSTLSSFRRPPQGLLFLLPYANSFDLLEIDQR